VSILLAFKFLTILPVPVPPEVPPRTMGRAVAWYPLVGAFLGLALAGADLLLSCAFPNGLRSVLVLALWVGLTGALHFDGFLDCCDGLLAPRSPEERLAILRDTHVGSFAVAGGVLLLLVKYAALTSLQGPLRLTVLLVAPVLARWAMAYVLVWYPYGRPGPGLGRLVKENAGQREFLVASVLASAVAGAAWQAWGLAAHLATWVVAVAIARWVMTRIPGLTGDVYGAVGELVELFWLLTAVAMVGRV